MDGLDVISGCGAEGQNAEVRVSLEEEREGRREGGRGIRDDRPRGREEGREGGGEGRPTLTPTSRMWRTMGT